MLKVKILSGSREGEVLNATRNEIDGRIYYFVAAKDGVLAYPDWQVEVMESL